MDKNVLKLARRQDGDTKFYPKDGNKVYEIKYRLPKKSCEHCLLQWRYVAGNNWGNCPNGTGAVGCGPQEEFRACADISITGKATDEEMVPEYTPETTTAQVPVPEPAYNPISTLIISLVSFLVVFSILFLLYFHFYQIGGKIKQWIGKKTQKPQEKQAENMKNVNVVPRPPPRVKKHSGHVQDGMYDVNLKANESLA